MSKKVYYLKSYYRGKFTVIEGTVEGLRKHFSYTLEVGHSWNSKINTEPKTYKSLINNINDSYRENIGSCYDPDYVTEATEDEFKNAESLGYRTHCCLYK